MEQMNQKQTDQIVNQVVKKLIDTQTTIATMESCTSGLIASMITDTEGASAIYPGGYVTYLNETKILVGVDAEVIRQYGVYSAECAEAMARTARKNLNTAIAIGITGTTGNVDPNNADSVQGKAYYCIVTGDIAHGYEIDADVTGLSRHEIKQMYANRVFASLADLIKNSIMHSQNSHRP